MVVGEECLGVFDRPEQVEPVVGEGRVEVLVHGELAAVLVLGAERQGVRVVLVLGAVVAVVLGAVDSVPVAVVPLLALSLPFDAPSLLGVHFP